MKINDRVRIIKNSYYYSKDEDSANPPCKGTIIDDNWDNGHKYRVLWDNGEINCYRDIDLELAKEELYNIY